MALLPPSEIIGIPAAPSANKIKRVVVPLHVCQRQQFVEEEVTAAADTCTVKGHPSALRRPGFRVPVTLSGRFCLGKWKSGGMGTKHAHWV